MKLANVPFVGSVAMPRREKELTQSWRCMATICYGYGGERVSPVRATNPALRSHTHFYRVKFARRHRLRIRLLEKLPRQRAILQKFLERATKRLPVQRVRPP